MSADLEHDWHALCRRLGLANTEAQWGEIVRRHQETGRAYHNLDHIADCLALLKDLSPADADTIALAIWFHDLVYDPTRGDNEAASAEQARASTTDTSLAARVTDLIMATQHGETSLDKAAMIICDVDLAILGAPRERYDGYARSIRREYGWVEESEYREKRAGVLRRFLARKRIYQTDYFLERFEEAARTNIRRELAALETDQE